jgi:hypothetical protein
MAKSCSIFAGTIFNLNWHTRTFLRSEVTHSNSMHSPMLPE